VDRVRALSFARSHPTTAVVVRNMFTDSLDAGLIETNPWSRLNIEQSSGRRNHDPLTIDELHRLADLALDVHGPEYGPVMRAMILFTAYVGPRGHECAALEWSWVNLADSEVTFMVAKFDKPRTVMLLPEAPEALRTMPRRTDDHPQVFRSKRGLPIRGRSAHYWSWNPVRAAFWATLPEDRRRAIVDLDWHSLRHFTGWLFYVHMGHSDELTAYQLGHSDAKLVRDLYGHGDANALERLKRASRVEVRPIRATSLPHAVGDSA
jgi:integrase